MPFADDVRKYNFASLDRLINKKGQLVEQHPYLPSDEQMDAMADFVDAMDLMNAGEELDDGFALVYLFIRPLLTCLLSGVVALGTTLACHTTRLFTGQSKPSFMRRL